jgi:hypothetical protein
LEEQGFSFSEYSASRGEVHLMCRNGDLEFDVCYEPFARPSCLLRQRREAVPEGKLDPAFCTTPPFLRQNYRVVRQIQVDSKFSTSAPLASGVVTQVLLSKHEEELERHCQALLKILPRETLVV